MTPRLRGGLPEFASAVWDFPKERRFLSWLFAEAPDTKIFVAHDGGRWLAAIGVFERVYQHDAGATPCFETYAWASLQTKETKGLGIKVIKAAMGCGRPLVALGGSSYTEEFMPRLGFDTVGMAPSLTLPLSTAAVGAGGGLRRQLMKLGLTLAEGWFRPSAKAGTVRHVPISMFDATTLAMPTLPGFQATFAPSFFEWQIRYPESGMFLPFRFMRDGEAVGWIFARVAEETGGILIGRILEAKFGATTTQVDHTAMLRTATASLAGFGVAAVRALTTCPNTVAALRTLRFIPGRQSPAMVYRNGLNLERETIRISVLRADGGVLPLPAADELHRRNPTATDL